MLGLVWSKGIARRIESATTLVALLVVGLGAGAALPLVLGVLREGQVQTFSMAVDSVGHSLSATTQTVREATRVGAYNPSLAGVLRGTEPAPELGGLVPATGASVIALTDAHGKVVHTYFPPGKDNASAPVSEVLGDGPPSGPSAEFLPWGKTVALVVSAPVRRGTDTLGWLYVVVPVDDRLALQTRVRLPSDWEVFFAVGDRVIASSAPEELGVARLGKWSHSGQRTPVENVTMARVRGPTTDYEGALMPLWGRGQVSGFWGLARPMGEQSAVLSRLLKGLLGILGAALALALVVGRRQARFITRGLATLSRQVGRVREGDMAIEGPAGPPRDEVEVVASALAEMSRELRRSFAEVRAERQKLQALVDRMAEGVVVVDESRHVVFLNPTASKMLELGEDRREADLAEFPQELSEPLEQCLQEATEREMEIQPQVAGGRFFRVRVAPVHVSSAMAGAMAVLTDITRHRELDEMKSDFIGYVAHELRNPLTVIKGFSELLLTTEDHFPEEYREMLEAVSLHADRLNDLVDSLLEMTRLDAGAPLVLKKETVDMQALLGSLVSVYRAYGSGHELALEAGDEDLRLQGDPERLGLIFSNLISNAIKYTPQGTQITLRARREGEVLAIEVADNGPGIPADHLPHIFDKFYRAPSGVRQRRRGSGIGLYLVKRLGEAHDGSVTVASVEGVGTTFTVTLPVVARSDDS